METIVLVLTVYRVLLDMGGGGGGVEGDIILNISLRVGSIFLRTSKRGVL